MIPGLDGLRAVAFLLVFAFHTDYLEFGWVGVQFFFVLSGFLITGILLDMKKSLSPSGYFIKFYGRRFLRIFPLYYFYLLLMSGVVAWLIAVFYRTAYMQIFQQQVWYAVFYIYDFFFGTILVKYSYFLDHFWSLSVEEQFYIFWPLLILLVPEKWLKKLFETFIVLGTILRIAFFFILLGALPVIGFASQYVATGSVGNISALGYPLLMPNAYQFIWGYSLLGYFFTIIIYSVVNYGMFTRLLESAPMRYLGKISYGLYVYHFPMIWFSARIRDLGLSEMAAKPLTALIAFIATLMVASLSFHLMEKPLLNLKDRFFSLKPGQT